MIKLTDEQKIVVANNIRLISMIAVHPLLKKMASLIDDPDSVAVFGLINAVQTHNPNKGKLSTWVTFHIKAAFFKELAYNFRQCRTPERIIYTDKLEVTDIDYEHPIKDYDYSKYNTFMQSLKPRQRFIIEERMKGKKLKDVGKALKITAERVRQLQYNIIKRYRTRNDIH